MLADCLAGLKVLDLSVYIPGPMATMWLSDLGADVVKVEPPARDPMLTAGPVDADGSTCFYKLVNRNKSVVILDLKSESGKELFAQLVGRADVLLESYRPGTLAKLGFPRDRLQALNPRLVHCAMSGFGQTGPHAKVAGHDVNYMAVTGGLAVTGPAERPIMTFPPLADHAGAMSAVMAILAALIKRGRTGQGCVLDVSLAEAALSWMGGVLTIARKWGEQPREAGEIDGGAAFYRLYQTADGRWAALAALEEKFWQGFCTAVGRPDWIARHRAEPLPQTKLIAELDALFATRTLAEWTALLAPVDCTFEPVLLPSEVPDHPHHAARGLVQAGGDGLVDVLVPFLMDETRAPARRPFANQTAEQVLAGWR
jgi:crotonobetainyl-CoA:carnitine CoA-transferase CaiB-like acyl-CoA transferase